jgi:hypothetical protein
MKGCLMSIGYEQKTNHTLNREKFEEAVRPLIKYLAEEHHPHVTVIATGTSAELVEGLVGITTHDYLRD